MKQLMQKTISKEINFTGVGLHSGKDVNVTILPAEENFGIRFVRTDLDSKLELKALYDNIVDTRNCSCLGDKNGNIVSTVEHIMSAFHSFGISNAIVEIDGPEFPILDGSSLPIVEELKNTGTKTQEKNKKALKVLKKVSFEDGKGASAHIEPADANLEINFEIDFPSKIIGKQNFTTKVNKDIFINEVSSARTFCQKFEVDALREMGLIKGGSLDNAIVFDNENILNEDGLRFQDECVRHKTLDAIGDLYLSGYELIGKYTGIKSGHFHNVELLKKLFADDTNYEIIDL
jgi:UDP-3-O-[3-hydroxymyristoyl] N-acetylglucosamine deacetylase